MVICQARNDTDGDGNIEVALIYQGWPVPVSRYDFMLPRKWRQPCATGCGPSPCQPA
jgi:hypothetical protein